MSKLIGSDGKQEAINLKQYHHSLTKPRISVGMGTCGIAAGAEKVRQRLEGEIKNRGLDIVVETTSCIGMCYREVIVEVTLPGHSGVIYGDITPDKVDRILNEHIVNGSPVVEWTEFQLTEETHSYYEEIPNIEDSDYYINQIREVTDRCGRINPENIEEYLISDGYKGLENAISLTSQEVIDNIKKSGLRGRGGGGFPTGLKWQFTHDALGEKKYIICNADEGDPGAFMDRSVLEGDPHAVLEGMAIAGYAIGSEDGYIYVRAEYPLAIKRLRIAILQAEEKGLLGRNILGTDFSFNIHIKVGAGAFVCGEETALLNSIEGKRGMPRIRPPFPAIKGLWDSPTNNNNVETYANVSLILRKGVDWYTSIGTEKSKGTKVFSLTGKINNTGLAEVPMGTTLRKIIYDIGGGIQNNKKYKAVQIGGPSGGCLPEEKLDLPVDYDSLIEAGAMMGSGGLVVMDEDTCMVDVAKYFLSFSQSESCGKCTPCREGTTRMQEILTRITEGKGKMEDLDTLESLSRVMKSTSLCGLGQTASNPVLSTLRYFRDEYINHIENKRCTAKVCTELITYQVVTDKCIGCTKCARVCPVNAISGKVKEPHYINPDICIKCGACMEACKFDAIIKI